MAPGAARGLFVQVIKKWLKYFLKKLFIEQVLLFLCPSDSASNGSYSIIIITGSS